MIPYPRFSRFDETNRVYFLVRVFVKMLRIKVGKTEIVDESKFGTKHNMSTMQKGQSVLNIPTFLNVRLLVVVFVFP